MKYHFLRTVSVAKDYLYGKHQRHNRIVQFSKVSVLLNTVIALGKIAMGLYSFSLFLCVSGLYNVGIGSARAVAVKGYNNSKKASNNGRRSKYLTEAQICYGLVGVIILITSFVYVFRVLIGGHSNTQYTGFMVIAVAAFTVIEIVLSIQGIITARRDKEPVLEAIKLTSFASSMISLALTQTAILSYTGQDLNIYLGTSGMFFGVLSAATGIYMIVHIYKIIRSKNHDSMNRKVMRIKP